MNSEIIKLTIENLEKYDEFAKARSEIELLFKISKRISGLEKYTYVSQEICSFKGFFKPIVLFFALSVL